MGAKTLINVEGNLPAAYSMPTLAQILAAGAAADSVAITGLAALTGAGDVSITKSAGTPWTQSRLVKSELTLTGVLTGKTTTSYAGVRGLLKIATSADSGFFYGTQGKLDVDGATIAIGSNHAAGLYGQISGSGATLTSGHIAAIIASGQSLPTSANVDMFYAESGGGKINSVLKSYVKASYLFDITNAESGDIVAAAGTGAGAAGLETAVATRVLKVLVDGVAAYIPLFVSNA